jgi:hypothetical protein
MLDPPPVSIFRLNVVVFTLREMSSHELKEECRLWHLVFTRPLICPKEDIRAIADNLFSETKHSGLSPGKAPNRYSPALTERPRHVPLANLHVRLPMQAGRKDGRKNAHVAGSIKATCREEPLGCALRLWRLALLGIGALAIMVSPLAAPSVHANAHVAERMARINGVLSITSGMADVPRGPPEGWGHAVTNGAASLDTRRLDKDLHSGDPPAPGASMPSSLLTPHIAYHIHSPPDSDARRDDRPPKSPYPSAAGPPVSTSTPFSPTIAPPSAALKNHIAATTRTSSDAPRIDRVDAPPDSFHLGNAGTSPAHKSTIVVLPPLAFVQAQALLQAPLPFHASPSARQSLSGLSESTALALGMPIDTREESAFAMTALDIVTGWAVTVGGVTVADDRDRRADQYGGMEDHGHGPGEDPDGSLIAATANVSGLSLGRLDIRFDDMRHRIRIALDAASAKFRDRTRREAPRWMLRRKGSEMRAVQGEAFTLGAKMGLRTHFGDAAEIVIHGGVRFACLHMSPDGTDAHGTEDRRGRLTAFSAPIGVTLTPRQNLFKGIGNRIRTVVDVVIVPAGGDLKGSGLVGLAGDERESGTFGSRGVRDNMDIFSIQSTVGLRLEDGDFSAGLGWIFRTGTRTSEHGGMLGIQYKF